MNNRFLIWSNEHKAWWKDGGWGYTPYFIEAGLFEKKPAMTICEQALLGGLIDGLAPEVMIPEQAINRQMQQINERTTSLRAAEHLNHAENKIIES